MGAESSLFCFFFGLGGTVILGGGGLGRVGR